MLDWKKFKWNLFIIFLFKWIKFFSKKGLIKDQISRYLDTSKYTDAWFDEPSNIKRGCGYLLNFLYTNENGEIPPEWREQYVARIYQFRAGVVVMVSLAIIYAAYIGVYNLIEEYILPRLLDELENLNSSPKTRKLREYVALKREQEHGTLTMGNLTLLEKRAALEEVKRDYEKLKSKLEELEKI